MYGSVHFGKTPPPEHVREIYPGDGDKNSRHSRSTCDNGGVNYPCAIDQLVG
jgi:hypothetical protein